MIPAFHTFHFSPMVGSDVPLPEVLAATQAAGFTSIGIDVPTLERHLALGGTVDDVVHTLGALDLAVTDVLYVPITADDDANRRSTDAVIGAAQRLGAPWCLTAVPEPIDADQLLSSLRTAAAHMAGAGTRMALEFSSHLHLATLSQAIDACAQVGWDRCAVVLDSLHFFRAGADWQRLATLHAEQIAFVQLSDASARPVLPLAQESRSHRELPGHGELPLRRFLDAVAATGFDGVVVAEVLSERLRGHDVRTATQLVHDALLSVLG